MKDMIHISEITTRHIDSRIYDKSENGFCKFVFDDKQLGRVFEYGHLLKHKSNGKKWITFCYRCGGRVRRYYRSVSLSQFLVFIYK